MSGRGLTFSVTTSGWLVAEGVFEEADFREEPYWKPIRNPNRRPDIADVLSKGLIRM